MGRVLVDVDKCKACMLCMESCPNDLLSLGENFNASGYTYIEFTDGDDCTGCGLCALSCPEAALQVYRRDREGQEKVVMAKTPVLVDKPTTYCPGCSHGIIHRLVAESIEEFGIQGESIGVTSIGCAIFIYRCLDIDYCEGAHGRAPAVATGFKRVHPDKVVFTYQGDGDIAAIGTAEIIHAAARNENITVFFVNNANYGMTGGQMAPTTLMGQVTTTTPYGRRDTDGFPIRVCELLSSLSGNLYLARGAVNTPGNIRKTKSYIKKALQYQISRTGFSLVEILGTCPANWRKSPIESVKYLEETLLQYYPLGEKRVPGDDKNGSP